jgi:hypothetical protein
VQAREVLQDESNVQPVVSTDHLLSVTHSC